MSEISQRLAHVRQRIATAEQSYRRPAGSVSLLAVSKGQPEHAIRSAIAAGQYLFGESYLQEAVGKITALADPAVQWHFIGRVQTNKAKLISRHFAWVQSVDSLRAAQHLNQHRPAEMAPLNVCIQVNISGEPQKSGVAPAQLGELAAAIAALPRLRLRGLMAIPAASRDFAQQRRAFKLVHEAAQGIRARGLALDTLSMGMSADLEAAIAEGATMVRIGTAVFGPRPAQKQNNIS